MGGEVVVCGFYAGGDEEVEHICNILFYNSLTQCHMGRAIGKLMRERQVAIVSRHPPVKLIIQIVVALH